MPILATIEGTLTVTADAMPGVAIDLFVADDDAPYIALNVTERAAIAASERHLCLGIGLQFERGDGELEPFPEVEKAREFNIREDGEQFGDTMTFKVAGPQYSPFDGHALLSRRGQIIAETVYGFGANEYRAQVFNGFVISSQFEDPPGVASVVCGDAGALHAEKRAKDYLIPENSWKTRLEITLEVLAICNIPAGALDVGPDGGGVFNKAAAPGDTPICSWLQAFWRVKGREVGFIDELFVINAWDGSRPAVAEITNANVEGPVTTSGPTTLDANVHGVVSVSVTHTEVGGPSAPVHNLTTITGTHVRDTAAEYQVGGSGTVIDYPVIPGPVTETLSELHTVSQKLGGVEIHFEEWELGFWNPAAARIDMQQTDPDTEDYATRPALNTTYIYEDGSAHVFPQAKLTEIRRTRRDKFQDVQGRIIRTIEKKYGIRAYRRHLFHVGHETGEWIPVGDDGQGMIGGREFYGGVFFGPGSSYYSTPGVIIPDEIIQTDVTLNAEGLVTMETVTRLYRTIGDEVRRAGERYGYGLDNPRYFWSPAEIGGTTTEAAENYTGRDVATRTYRVLDEDSYVFTESTRINGGNPRTETSNPIAGSLPRPEKVEPTSSNQEVRALAKNQKRIDYADGEEIVVTEHNEFIQNEEEAAEYARHLARIASALRVSFAMPFEGQIHKWKPVNVTLPGSGIYGKKCEVRTVERDGASRRQTVTVAFYDPALS